MTTLDEFFVTFVLVLKKFHFLELFELICAV